VDPYLQDTHDPIALFQVYLQWYHVGTIAPRGKPVRARTVEDSLRAVGQTFAALGAPDPRLDRHGNIDFRLQRQLRGYSRADPPPNRVKPIPTQILHHIAALTSIPSATPGTQAIADMISLAFFFLLRPGEYTGTASDTTPFTLHDVQCWIGHQRMLATEIPIVDLSRAHIHHTEKWRSRRSHRPGSIRKPSAMSRHRRYETHRTPTHTQYTS
jgi:hypothetical protein